MVCIHCGSETRVINSRFQKRANRVWRRRKCNTCSAIYTTEETALYSAAWAIKSRSGKLIPFSRDKLLLSLYKSCEHRKNALEDASGLTDTVIKQLMTHAKSSDLDIKLIQQITQVALNRFDKAASVHYQAFHS